MARTGWIVAGAVVLALGAGFGGAWAQTAAAPAGTPAPGVAGTSVPGDVVATRKNEMKAMQRDLEAIKKVLDAGGSVGELAPQANEIHQIMTTVPAVFPPGSESGDSKALPAVWSDRAGFERAAANALAASEKFQGAVASGDNAATATAFRELGTSCGGCHRNYRGR